jgi:SAM-dependent methyltransferase
MSTDRRVVDAEVANCLCPECGAIFNAGGARTQAQQFYAETYALHGESVLSEWQVHVDGEIRGENDAILDFILSSCPLAPQGRILEIGCGKGVLLGKFLKAMPGWQASAVEPSANAAQYFRRILPQVRIHEGAFDTAPFRDGRFDFVAVSGVLEHVLDPVRFMEEVRGCIAPGGCAYVGLPNFEAKPDDLVLYDHLTQFTPATLDLLYARAGFRVLHRDARADRVWLWDALVSADPAATPREAERVGASRALFERHEAAVARARSEFARMISECEVTGVGAALFGLGVLGLLDLSIAGARAKPVRFLLDDNPHVWGTRRLGLEIRGSQELPALGVEAVFLAASPVYHPRMREKLEAVGIRPERIYG